MSERSRGQIDSGQIDALTAAVGGLKALGFSETEAVIYCELLQCPRATGYRLAQRSGKSQANTYQALAGLRSKGAAVIDGEGGLVAVPYRELLDSLRSGLEQQFEQVERSLRELPATAERHRPRPLETADDVYRVATKMIDAAREVIVFTLFPKHFLALRGPLQAAQDRHVQVVGGVYDAAQRIEGGKILMVGSAERLVSNTIGDELELVTDAEQLLVAMTDKKTGRVLEACQSDNDLLAYLHHQGVISDFVLEEIGWHESANRFFFGRFPAGTRRYYRET